MNPLQAILLISNEYDLDDEEDIKRWEVEKIQIDGEYIAIYTIITQEDKEIEVTIMSKYA